MKFDKYEARKLAPIGWEYAGHWDGFYHYQKPTGKHDGYYFQMLCLAEDLTPQNMEFMAKHGLSRTGLPNSSKSWRSLPAWRASSC